MKQIDIQKNGPPVGYNPIAEIRGAMFHEICVPFNKMPIWCMLTCLNFMQLRSCGDISTLYFPDKKQENKEPDILEIIKRKNAQEAVCKLTLVHPTFDAIIGDITKSDFRISEKEEQLKKIKTEIKALKPGPEKRKAEKLAECIEYQIGFLLPDDTMGFITAWALGVEITDIKKVSRDILLEAALMAKQYGNNTTNHISGVFTDFQEKDINKWGLYLYNQFIADKKIEQKLKKNSYKWTGRK